MTDKNDNNTNRQWLLKQRPVGMVTQDCFELAESDIPTPAEGEVLAKMTYLSFAPAMRGWITDMPSYMPPIEIGSPVTAPGLAEVIESNDPNISPGDFVSGLMSWSEYVAGAGWQVVDKNISPEMQLGPLSETGMTAYAGLIRIGELKEGDTVLVSGAAGATGSVAAQIARLKGHKTVGIAGGQEKCDWLLNEAKLDAAIDYKNDDISKALREHFPNGVDVYFENVGGDTLQTVINHLADGARVALCGMISGYNDETPRPGPNNLMLMIVKRITMRGFLVFDHFDLFAEARENIANWVKSGEIAFRNDVQEGFLNIPKTFFRLFEGENKGKQLLKL